MNYPTIKFDGKLYRVYRYGFIAGTFTSRADALAHQAKLIGQKTNHPDYSLQYPSRDGTGMPIVHVHPA